MCWQQDPKVKDVVALIILPSFLKFFILFIIIYDCL